MANEIKMNITIPPEALEAGARALADAYYRNCTDGRLTMADTDDVPEDWYVEARAAIAAALNAWPGMTNYVGYEGDELVQIITLSAKVQ